jgi:hypothetical protein
MYVWIIRFQIYLCTFLNVKLHIFINTDLYELCFHTFMRLNKVRDISAVETVERHDKWEGGE